MSSRRLAILFSVLVTLVVAACSTGAAATGSPSASATGTLTVTGAWVRAAAAGKDTAAYFTIENGTSSDDTLVGASTTIAGGAGLHQTTTDASGMTGMHMTESVKVAAGGTVQFAPGGYHVMLTALTAELKAGDKVVLQLAFEHAGVVKVTCEVRTS